MQPKPMKRSDATAPIMNHRDSGLGVKRSSIAYPLFVATEALLPTGAFGQRNGVEDLRALVAKDRESAADCASRLVVTIAAGRVEIHARARNERDRALHGPHDLAERNVRRRPRELIAALGAPGTFDQARFLEVEHDQLEIFGRHAL